VNPTGGGLPHVDAEASWAFFSLSAFLSLRFSLILLCSFLFSRGSRHHCWTQTSMLSLETARYREKTKPCAPYRSTRTIVK
jgi:hypothetical protein